MREIPREADWVDAAAAQTEVMTETAIATRKLPPAPLPPGYVLEDADLVCMDCGGDIPEARVRAGYVNCVECQEAHERWDARYAR